MFPNFQAILKQYWKFDSFRPLQLEIIESIFSETDTLALMPTGGGKSLCYQIPTLAKDGLCLVISPLIALMKDQVESLRKKNITAFSIQSGMPRKEIINILRLTTNSNCKFLFVSPERLETNLFKEYLPGMGVKLIAVDEAHCISQWGYDFRPSYLKIAALREVIPQVPILALTASATVEVQKDICKKLLFKKEKIFCQAFHRHNLSYSVFNPESKSNKLIEILNNVSGSSLVYCRSRKRTKEISDLLRLQNIDATFYHAGMTPEDRNTKQEDWIQNKTRVLVCTSAFGMGIDKPDVRTVVHMDVPDCLESYYQEAGRAGRDGKKSFTVLLYQRQDIDDLKNMANIRFPSSDDIKKVYQGIANYLQIPADSGAGQYFNLDTSDFCKKFKLNNVTVLYAMKALEQEGWLSYNEQVFMSSTLQFTTNKKSLHDFEKSNPQLEKTIKIILRSYEGVFDFPTFISELFIAIQTKKDISEIKQQLAQLHQQGIVCYVPQKDSPQLFFLQNRIKLSDFFINTASYRTRKKIFLQRVAFIVKFIKESSVCRSKMIGNYFGDDTILDCGICDNCLSRKKMDLTKEDFEKISSIIKATVQHKSISTKELLQQLKGIKKEKIWKVLEFLQTENKIEIDKSGCVSWN